MQYQFEKPDKRFRSRSPLNERTKVSGDCLFCADPIADRKPWVCINGACKIIAHESCMLKSDDATRSQTPGRKGCPQCRTRMRDAIDYFTKTHQPAPHGAWCMRCGQDIPHKTPMMRCAAPRSHCLAVYHAHCRPWKACFACHLSVYDALCLRTRDASERLTP